MSTNIKNILFLKSDNEWYTPLNVIIDFLDYLNIPQNKVIWCPFDTKESNFVKELENRGYKVIYSHISEGEDFFEWEPKEQWDIILSNPPFTKKRLLIERAMEFNKPFYLLFGCSIFSQSMGNTLNKLNFHFIQKQVKFINNQGEFKKFLCVWISNIKFRKEKK